MKVGVDARALLAGRGVARFTRELLAALADGFAEDEWLAFVPGRAPVAPVHPRVTLVRHRLGGRALFGAAALAGRPTLAGLVGGADVVWLPAPAPVAPGAPYVLTVHDRSWERRPRDFSAYERVWHALARPRALARGAARGHRRLTGRRGRAARGLGRAGHRRLPGHHGPAGGAAPGALSALRRRP